MKKVGKVKSYKSRNGCGFIYGDEGERDVFVHVSNILPNEGDPSDILIPDEEVEYELFDGRRGPAATSVRRLNPVTLSEFHGSIKKSLSREGYGFIESEAGDVFFHFADVLNGTPNIGDRVTYLLLMMRGKPRAVRVQIRKE